MSKRAKIATKLKLEAKIERELHRKRARIEINWNRMDYNLNNLEEE